MSTRMLALGAMTATRTADPAPWQQRHGHRKSAGGRAVRGRCGSGGAGTCGGGAQAKEAEIDAGMPAAQSFFWCGAVRG